VPTSKTTQKPAVTARQKKQIKQHIKRHRPAHKQVLLHPIFIFALLVAFVFVIDWTFHAFADTTISATIEAPPLTEGANISSPMDGAIYTSSTPITVAGSCPLNSYVSLTQNGKFSGVSICSSTHTFHVEVTLHEGANAFVATAYNITDQPGPATPPVTVQLDLPQTPPKPSPSPVTTKADKTTTNATPAVTAAPPLVLDSAFQWQTFQTNSKFSWKLDVEGGLPPYVVEVNWGDGETTKYNFAVDPVFEVTHQYTQPGYFVIKANSVDAVGNQQIMQLAALINTPGKAATYLSSSANGGTATTPNMTNVSARTHFFVSTKNWLWVAWPSLVIVVLMTFSFWLGEAEDHRLMVARRRVTRRYR